MEAASALSGSANVYLTVCLCVSSTLPQLTKNFEPYRTGLPARDRGNIAGAILMLMFKSGNRVKSLENSFLNIECTYQSQILTSDTKRDQHAVAACLGLGFVLAQAKHKGSCLIFNWSVEDHKERERESICVLTHLSSYQSLIFFFFFKQTCTKIPWGVHMALGVYPKAKSKSHYFQDHV